LIGNTSLFLFEISETLLLVSTQAPVICI